MNQQTNHYLAEEKISKLMLKFAIPCIMSLLVSSLYNIVDQIFIGRGVGYLGNGATNVVFPITVIALALALMVGDAAAAFLSICQGKKDTESAHKTVGNAIVLISLLGIVLMILFFILKEPILKTFGATENNIGYAREYFDYITIGLPFYMFGITVNGIIRADGNPRYSMLCVLVGCIINIILDPIAIFVLGWGMKGAAIATIIGQIATAIMAGAYLVRMKSLHLKKSSFKLSFSMIAKFLPLGISSLLTQLSVVVVMAVMNTTLVRYGALSKYGADIPLTVLGIVFKIYSIVLAFVIGIAVGCQPLFGFNYGAGKFDRVKKIYATMIKAECVVGLIAFFIFQIFPLQITRIFGSEEGLYNEFAVLAFRIFLSTIVLSAIQKATSIFFQSLGKPVKAFGLSLIRDFVVNIPMILLLPRFFGVTGALLSAPIADIVAFALVVILVVMTFKQLDRIQFEEVS